MAAISIIFKPNTFRVQNVESRGMIAPPRSLAHLGLLITVALESNSVIWVAVLLTKFAVSGIFS